jgi:hypothetical protein
MWYYNGYQLDAQRNTKVDIAIQKTQILSSIKTEKNIHAQSLKS